MTGEPLERLHIVGGGIRQRLLNQLTADILGIPVVTGPVEEQLSQVAGVRRVTSRSREGQAVVRLRFHWGTDMEFAALHVRDRGEEALPLFGEDPGGALLVVPEQLLAT